MTYALNIQLRKTLIKLTLKKLNKNVDVSTTDSLMPSEYFRMRSSKHLDFPLIRSSYLENI
jgi:hypothetical protein